MADSREVVVTDIRMPFLSMVVFMIKWAIAAIPAIMILSALFALFTMIFGGFMGGFFGGVHHMGRSL